MQPASTMIMNSRLYPQKTGGSYIKREALRNRLVSGLKNNLILICGPAGYGKTTLVLDLLSQTDFDYSWLGVHNDMKNFYTFISYLVHSIRVKNTDFGNVILSLVNEYRERMQLSKNRERIVKDITEAFVNELNEAFGKPNGSIEDFTLIIDDLGNISESDWLNQCFNIIFENISPSVHFIITSRSLPDFNLSVLTAKRNILRIEAGELAFTTEEARKLLSEIYNIAADKDDISILVENLNGWITGLHLILQSYGKGFLELRLDKIVILDDIYNYFTEDIFNALEKEVQDFLLKTCLFESFSVELCNELFPGLNSEALIKRLLKQNIFIREVNSSDIVENENRYYAYQPLFKSFLEAKLKHSPSAKEIDEIFKNASEYFLKRSDHNRAIKCSLRSADTNESALMIKEHYRLFFTPGNFESIWDWLSGIKESEISGNCFLLFLKANLQILYKGDIESSNITILKALSTGMIKDTPGVFINCCVLYARNLIRLGKISEAIAFLNETVNSVKEENGKAKLLFLTSYAHYQNSEYEGSLELLDKATEIIGENSSKDDLKETMLDIYNLYGNISLIRGDYSKSIAYYEYALKNDEKIFDRFEAYCNLVLLHSQSGKFDKAREHLENACTLAAKVTIPIFKISYLLAKQGLLYEFGDYEGNIKILEEINNIAFKINHKYYIFLSYSLIGDSYFNLSRFSKAEEYYDLAFKYLNDKNRLEQVQYMVSKALLIKKIEISVPEDCEEVLLEAHDFYTKNKFTYNKAQTSFHLSDYYLKKNDLFKAAQFLKECLSISEEKEYTSFLERELSGSRTLFDLAETEGMNLDFIYSLKDSFVNKKMDSDVSAECRIRIGKEILDLYDIRAELFGKSSIFIRGELISDSEWSKKKWKLIFVDLLISKRKELSKDRIIDNYYPDTSIDSADNIFHQMISKFRGLAKSRPSQGIENLSGSKNSRSSKKDERKGFQLINYEDKTLKLNKNLLIYTDTYKFDKFYREAQAETNTEIKIELLKKTVELYKGDLMEGNYETWVEEMRSKYRSYFTSSSELLIKYLYRKQDYERTLHYSENLLKHDKLNLTTYVYIINSHAKNNEFNLAKEIYNLLEKKYNLEFGESLPKSIINEISIRNN